MTLKVTRRNLIKAGAAAVAVVGLTGRLDGLVAASRGGPAPRGARRSLAANAAPASPKPATTTTANLNAALLEELPFSDEQDFSDAALGLVAVMPDGGYIANPPGLPSPAMDLTAYPFLADETAPPEVNPSLWRQARLNMNNGLFQVVDGLYQVRGADMGNLTIIEGETGVILVDPLTTTSPAAAALALYREHRGPRPVVAVIYTHSHTDHYGGVRGVVDQADVDAGKVAILAPDGFIDSVCRENVFAGTAMSRRSGYSYGVVLPRGIDGQIDVGLGKAMSIGPITLIPPTDTITATGETRILDGVEFEFQMAPDTEAPSEMMFHLPAFRVLDAAELACSTLHNIYTLRGAEVRDASAWSGYLDEAIERFGDATDVVIGQHHWPTFGHDAVIDYLKHQRDLYKYLHDQTLRLANKGYTMTEIAETLAHDLPIPASLAQEWYARGYYGSVSHDAKAVYQKYLGWYDCNPANLEPLPPEEAGARYTEFMGGADNVLEQAQAAFDAGDYRWVATVTNHVVFADPGNTAARALCADALEQLGYQSESAIWRNQYLMGAYELRNGRVPMRGSSANVDTLTAMSVGLIFDYLGVRLDPQRAEGQHIVLDWILTDPDEQYTLNLENSALTYRSGTLATSPDATISLSRATLDGLLTATDQKTALEAAMKSGAIRIEGDATKVVELLGMLDTFGTESFNIVEP